MAEPANGSGGRQPLFERVLICGVGLIGGSIGLALRQQKLAATVVGWDQQPTALASAVRLGAIDEAAKRPEATGAELVIIATPVGAIANVLTALAPSLQPGTIVTDVGSVKAPVLSAVSAAVPAGVTFIGGHPMAGKAVAGVGAAAADLFVGARWVLTPAGSEPAAREAVETLSTLVRRLGAEPVIRAASVHDEQVAAVSHLPQVASSALVLAAQAVLQGERDALELAAGGWRDTTRLASSDPAMWRDICLANRTALLAAINEYSVQLARFAAAVAAADSEALFRLFELSRQAKAAEATMSAEEAAS